MTEANAVAATTLKTTTNINKEQQHRILALLHFFLVLQTLRDSWSTPATHNKNQTRAHV
jgi:hypothetical protein